MRWIAARLGRAPSTISRELGRNAEAPGRYRQRRARQPGACRAAETAKLATNLALRGKVEQYLEKKYSRHRRPAAGGVPRRSRR